MHKCDTAEDMVCIPSSLNLKLVSDDKPPQVVEKQDISGLK